MPESTPVLPKSISGLLVDRSLFSDSGPGAPLSIQQAEGERIELSAPLREHLLSKQA